MKLDICRESNKIARMLINDDVLFSDAKERWNGLKNRLFKHRYLSKSACEEDYGVESRVMSINFIEELSDTILYYSDRWHPARVWVVELAFQKISKMTIS